jgi:hypothetical protein
MVVGMELLEYHSPIKVDWLNKWMSITTAGSVVQLHGLYPSVLECSMVEILLTEVDQSQVDNTYLLQQNLPEQIQQLLDSFADLFQEPTELPPSRSCDHTIPLIEGVQPVNMRPYRFSPAMKDEVE